MKDTKKVAPVRYTAPSLTKVATFGKDAKGNSQRGRTDTTASGHRMV
ncbi:hypothetical protein ACTVZO_43975 [Streptomyces sp. IBSNAI002]